MKTLPKDIYVKWEQDGDDYFLIAGETPADISELETSIPAGRYILKENITVVNKTKATV